MNCFSICSVTVKSAITPSFIGRIAVMLPGVRPEHLLGREADFLDHALAVGSAFLANRHDRRLVQHDALAADVDQRVGRTEIDREIAGKIAFEEFEHWVLLCSEGRVRALSPMRKPGPDNRI